MVNDATLVTDDIAREAIMTVEQQYNEGGADAVEDALAEYEPILAGHIRREAERIAWQLVVSGAPGETAQFYYFDALRLAISSVQAMRQGHASLWSDDEFGPSERSAVVLVSVGNCEVAVIRAVREWTCISLSVAKALVDEYPIIIAKQLRPEQATELVAAITAAGGKAEII